MTKTFKIGEYAVGGIITVIINKGEITIINKEWDDSAGFNKKSNQSNAKELSRYIVMNNNDNAYIKLYDILNELTSHYYTEEIIKWINLKIKIRQIIW
jgi:hypothetical protein